MWAFFFYHKENFYGKRVVRMQLTVKDIMDFDTLLDAKVRTANSVLPSRPVEWVSITETPVENFVRKHELVLTTGIGCSNDMMLFEQFVRDVIESEASALAIATGRYIFDLPPEIICLAEEHDFPIIEVPWEVRFADITHDVMKELTKRQQTQSRKSEEVQQQLLTMILHGESLTKVAKYIAKQIGYSVVITDKKGHCRGRSDTSRLFLEKWQDNVDREVVPDESSLTDSTAHHPLHTKIKKIMNGKETMIQLPIIQEYNRVQGYLFVVAVNQSPMLTTSVVNILEHGVTASALAFVKENAIEETKMRLRDDFVWSLTKAPLQSLDQSKERASLLGYDLSADYICIVGFPENFQKIFQKKDYESYQQWVNSMIHYIKEEMIYAGESLHKKTMVTYQAEHFIIFLEVHDHHDESVHHFLDLLERRMTHLLPEVILSYGISDFHQNEAMFTQSYENANLALKIGRTQKGVGFRVHYADTKMERALLSLASNAEICIIAKETVTPLVEYEFHRDVSLIDTITVFNEHQCNVSKTARALSLHRQSLLYRLRKIESLTGLSLVDPNDLFLLNMSLKIWGLQKVREEK